MMKNNVILGLVRPTNTEPWVELEDEIDFQKYEKIDLIKHNQQLRQIEKYRFYQLIFDFLYENRIEGDYHEFGCHRCRTFRMVLTEARRRSMDYMKFYAYDSFKGLPEISTKPTQETWIQGALETSEEEFLQLVQQHGIYLDKIHTIVGFYDKSLNKELCSKFKSMASLITVDCDLYESAIPVFDFIKSIIQNGTVLYIDDYYTGYGGDPRKGVAKSFSESGIVDEFIATPFLDVGWWGKSFIMHGKDK